MYWIFIAFTLFSSLYGKIIDKALTGLPQDDPELTCIKPSPHSPLCRQPKIAALIPILLCHVMGWNFTYLNILIF